MGDWERILRAVHDAKPPFYEFGRRYFSTQVFAPLAYFVEKLGKEAKLSIHYPPLCPVWLFPYGVTQERYLHDLQRYWDNVHTDYFIPWETTRIGHDTPTVARIKRLGEVSRREIDEVARWGGLHVKH